MAHEEVGLATVVCTTEEVDEIVRWLTGYSQWDREARLPDRTDVEAVFEEAPQMEPSRTLVRA